MNTQFLYCKSSLINLTAAFRLLWTHIFYSITLGAQYWTHIFSYLYFICFLTALNTHFCSITFVVQYWFIMKKNTNIYYILFDSKKKKLFGQKIFILIISSKIRICGSLYLYLWFYYSFSIYVIITCFSNWLFVTWNLTECFCFVWYFIK